MFLFATWQWKRALSKCGNKKRNTISRSTWLCNLFTYGLLMTALDFTWHLIDGTSHTGIKTNILRISFPKEFVLFKCHYTLVSNSLTAAIGSGKHYCTRDSHHCCRIPQLKTAAAFAKAMWFCWKQSKTFGSTTILIYRIIELIL